MGSKAAPDSLKSDKRCAPDLVAAIETKIPADCTAAAKCAERDIATSGPKIAAGSGNALHRAP
jgi:sarcosine oxidase gamma subunit